MMSYLEKKYGRNIVSQKIIPEKKKQKVIKLKLKTLCILLIISLILGIVIGYTFSNIKNKLEVHCVYTLKGGG